VKFDEQIKKNILMLMQKIRKQLISTGVLDTMDSTTLTVTIIKLLHLILLLQM